MFVEIETGNRKRMLVAKWYSTMSHQTRLETGNVKESGRTVLSMLFPR
jgi:hypothetical protein